jgi:hypothetical protein
MMGPLSSGPDLLSLIISYIPERPGRRGSAAPAPSQRLHREALTGAVDPETASGKVLLLPKEGRVASVFPAVPTRSAEPVIGK